MRTVFVFVRIITTSSVPYYNKKDKVDVDYQFQIGSTKEIIPQ